MTDQSKPVRDTAAPSSELYASAPKAYPRKVKGRYRQRKTVLATVLLVVLAVVPWLRWDRGAGQPDQAVLFSFPNMRAYFLDTVIWAQQFYFLTAILILACFALFLATALYGRVWCGFSCPQTIWTDLFVWIESLVEGDRNARMALDKRPWTAAKLGRKLLKHALWLAVSVLTGFVFMSYFTDTVDLARGLAHVDLSAISWGFLGLFAGGTYLMAGWVRDQMCTYMCPWPRIQGGMLDEQTLIVTYDTERGEPRGHAKKGGGFTERGHCVDCKMCVQVCPVGIDIRDGSQLQCIGCGLCADACAPIMARFNLPPELIGWKTIVRGTLKPKLFRPRTLVYLGLIFLTLVVTGIAGVTGSSLGLSVLADRSPASVRLSDGSVRAGYTMKVANHLRQPVDTRLTTDLDGAVISVIGQDGDGLSAPLSAGTDTVATYRVLLRQPAGKLHAGNTPVHFTITDADGHSATTGSAFISESGQ